MARRIEFTAQADRDLTALYLDGAAKFGIAQTDAYIAAMDAGFQLLAAFPEAGTRWKGSDRSRRYLFCSHQIIYEASGVESLKILRILHARQLPRDAL